MRKHLTRISRAALCAALCMTANIVPYTADAQNLNPTGRDVSLSVPLRERGRILGDVVLHLSATDEIAVNADTLATLLDPLLTDQAGARLRAAADGDGRIGPDVLAREGFVLDYDPAELALSITSPGSARALETLSVDRRLGLTRPDTGERPTDVSFYTNVRLGLEFDEFEIDDSVQSSATVRFDSALAVPQLDHAVLEATYALNGDGDFDFGSARVVYDQPELDRRWRLGQVTSPSLGIEGNENALALQVASGDVLLRRQDLVLETGPTTFTLERESEVRILVNGVVTRSFLLQPGNFDIRDFPINEGFNRVTVEVEDDLGRRELLSFDTFNDRRLKRVGEQDYALTAGVLERLNDQEDFQFTDPFVAGFYERGVTERFTAGAYAKASTEAQVAGVVGTVAAMGSLFDIEAATSQSDGDVGAYGAIGVSRVWYEEDSAASGGSFYGRDARAFNAFARIQTEEFSTSLLDLDDTSGNMIDLSAGYSQNFGPWRWRIGADAQLQAFDGSEDSYGARIGLGRSYGNFAFSSDVGYEFGEEDEVTGSIRLSYRFGPYNNADIRYDLRQKDARATYRHRSARNGVGAWNASVTSSYGVENDNAGLSGNFNYQGNRGIARLAHDVDLETLDGDELGNRTSLDFETSFAFAGGRFGVGQPVDNSFVLVYGHPSLDGEPVYVQPSGNEYVARSGILGAAVVDARDYRDSFVGYDVREAPLGYDLGTGVFTVNPTYRSGYALRVGSAYSVTVVGSLLTAEGDPVSLLVGEARALDDDEAPVLTVFTNRAGRFAMQGAGPGRWRIAFPGTPAFTITIPEDATGLVRLGELRAE